MGRTLPPFRPALEIEIESWNAYRRALRPEDRIIFDRVMDCARHHADAGSLAARPILSEIIFFSSLIELEKRIEVQSKILEAQVKRIEVQNRIIEKLSCQKDEINELNNPENQLKSRSTIQKRL